MTSGNVADRARALGLRTTQADGNDVTALAATADEIITRIRDTGKPEFLHAETYRLSGHTYFDPATYRPEGEAKQMQDTTCPIMLLREALGRAGVGETEMDNLHRAAADEMEAALDAARAAPWPENDSVFADVQDVGSPAVEAF